MDNKLFSPYDIKITYWPEVSRGGMSTGRPPKGVKLVYIPTGEELTCAKHRAQHKNKAECIKLLEEYLKEIT